ncbi:MAG: hypothetical protein AB7S75_05250 [Desulfococcaceae bacterium]
MEKLFKKIDGEYLSWSSGCASFLVGHKDGLWRLSVAVECRIGNLEQTYLTLLDTGAEWSVIGGDTMQLLEEKFLTSGQPFPMSTRLGKIDGSLYRIPICLLAEHGRGNDLTVDSTVFVSDEWKGPVVLGYRGFLERIRFAFDPGVQPGEQMFYFGIPD